MGSTHGLEVKPLKATKERVLIHRAASNVLFMDHGEKTVAELTKFRRWLGTFKDDELMRKSLLEWREMATQFVKEHL